MVKYKSVQESAAVSMTIYTHIPTFFSILPHCLHIITETMATLADVSLKQYDIIHHIDNGQGGRGRGSSDRSQ